MYSLPQEIEVWYIIPAIRRQLSMCLINDHHVTYERVGKLLGITKAAVSQYLKNKRAAKIELPKDAVEEVCKSCKLIVVEKRTAVHEISRILAFIRKHDLPCKVCDKHENGVLEGCKEIRIKRDFIDKWNLKEYY